MEELDLFMKFISQVGFPIVVALYLLVRVDKTIEKSTEALTELTKTIIELKELIENMNEKNER
ncbi:MAG: YvrJ family protein [Dictyoglomus thermophilum]